MKKFIYFMLVALAHITQTSELTHVVDIIHRYTRPITFLGVFKNDDKGVVQALAQDFSEHVFVLWGQGTLLLEHKLPNNYIRLNAEQSADRIKRLGEAEHFDVVFVKDHVCALNDEYAHALYDLGEHVFVYVERKDVSLVKHLVDNNFSALVMYNDASALFYSAHPITFLKRTQWLEKSSDCNYVRHIHSTWNEKVLHKKYGPCPTSTTWVPGINLITFKMLEGKIPSSYTLRREIHRLFSIPHIDWMPNNMVVRGKKVELIDYEDPYGDPVPKAVQDETMLDLVTKFAASSNTEKAVLLFQDILNYCKRAIHG